MNKTLRISSPSKTGGISCEDGFACRDGTAPIWMFMVRERFSEEDIKRYCKVRGWKCEEIP